jgi:hypothetical protein
MPWPSSPIPSFVEATDAAPRPEPMVRNAASIGPPSARTALPAATSARPVAIARGTRGAASDPAMTATLKGAKTSPFSVPAFSSAKNIAGVVVAVSAAATRLPRTSGAVRAARGTSGRRVESASSATPASPDSSSDSLSPSSSAARPSVTVTAPAIGIGARAPRTSGRSRPASTAPATPTGTLTANTHSHPNALAITPPSTHPDAPPPAAAAVQMPSAR